MGKRFLLENKMEFLMLSFDWQFKFWHFLIDVALSFILSTVRMAITCLL